MPVDLQVDSDIAEIKGMSGTATGWSAKVTAVFRRVCHSDSNSFGPNALLDAVVSTTGIPVGGLMDFPSTTIPDGFVLCDGRALSRTTHAGLFAVIGTRFGSDGAGTFKVPDFRRRQAVGRSSGAGVGTQTGSEVAVMAPEHLPAHSHGVGSISVAAATDHGHRDGVAFGDGQDFSVDIPRNSGRREAVLIMPSPELVSLRAQDTNYSDTPGRPALSEDLHSNTAGAHSHGTSSGTTDSAGSSENIGIVSPSITMVKCIYAGQT